MKRELAYGAWAVRKRAALKLVAWSVPEILPTAVYGIAVARATDSFLGGHAWQGIAWLGGLVATAGLGSAGARQVYARLGDLVEPLRDDLVRRWSAERSGPGTTDRSRGSTVRSRSSGTRSRAWYSSCAVSRSRSSAY